MLKKLSVMCFQGTSLLAKVNWVPGLLTRVAVGVVFALSGWGKLNHLDKVTEYFVSLGIPAANIQAPFVASVELVGGVLLFMGLMTRIASIPLAFTMVVAIVTAKKADIAGVSDLFGMSEFLFIVCFIWLIFYGAGKVSLDFLISKKLRQDRAE